MVRAGPSIPQKPDQGIDISGGGDSHPLGRWMAFM
jgi:hypothetical protein